MPKASLRDFPFGLLMPGRDYQSGSGTKERFTGKEWDEERSADHLGARALMAPFGRFPSPDRYADNYPSWSPYQYVFNNPIRFTDLTGHTVEVDPNLLEPVFYKEGEKKGQTKSLEDMTPEEKQRYFFQQWWSKNKEKILSFFGIGGKYETTNVIFKLGRQPLGFWESLFKGHLVTERGYRARTAWGKHGAKEEDLYTGTKAVKPDFGIDKLSIYFYFNPEPAGGVRSSTPEHEWGHGRIIFDRVKRGLVVPSGLGQHELMKDGNIPEIK